MTEQICANCGASLPATGTFCLACNTPVAGANRGLSVGEPVAAKVGRPWAAVLIVLAVIGTVAGLGYGMYAVMRPHPEKDITTAAKGGVAALVKAQGGRQAACKKLTEFLAGQPTTYRPQCRTMLGTDPGAHLTGMHLDAPKIDGDNATIRITATLLDDAGSKPFDQTFSLSNAAGSWQLVWDGKPLV